LGSFVLVDAAVFGRKKIFGASLGDKKTSELPANVTVSGLDLKKANVTVQYRAHWHCLVSVEPLACFEKMILFIFYLFIFYCNARRAYY
jgi:hypothetical protein